MVKDRVETPPGRYKPTDRIAAGGMAEVFLARDTLLNRNVVVKRIKQDIEEDPAFVGMFLDEARTIAQFNHPHIVKIYDIGFDGKLPFMAMEWLNGWDVRTILRHLRRKHGQMDLGVGLRMLIDACSGLHAAHIATTEEGQPLKLVHRDVSPQNLFVTVDGYLKLLDFGIAKTAIQQNVTREGELKGKFAYMSPEQFEGGPIDRRADIFSLGVILHELLTGRALFAHLDPHECYHAVTCEPIPVPKRDDSRIPEELCRITMRALERDPPHRFPTAALFGDALEEAAHTLGCRRSHSDVASYLSELFSDRTSHARKQRSSCVWTTPPTAPSGRLDPEDKDEYWPSTLPSPAETMDDVDDFDSDEPMALEHSTTGSGAANAASHYQPRYEPVIPTRPGYRQRSSAGMQLQRSSVGWMLMAAAMLSGVICWHMLPRETFADRVERVVLGDEAAERALESRERTSRAAAAPIDVVAEESTLVEGHADVPCTAGSDLQADAGARDPQDDVAASGKPTSAPPKACNARIVGRGRKGRFVKIALKWDAVPGATGYQVQLSRSKSFRRKLVDVEVATSKLIKNRIRAGDYFCRARTKTADGDYGPFSAPHPVSTRSRRAQNSNARIAARGLGRGRR